MMNFEEYLEKVEKQVDDCKVGIWRALEELSFETGLHLDDDLPELVVKFAERTFEE